MDQAFHPTGTVTIPIEQYETLLAENALLKESLQELHEKSNKIEQELEKFRRMLFGISSERFVSMVDPNQIALGLEGVENLAPPVETETITVTHRKHQEDQRKGHPRLELPDSLPREVTVIEPKEDVSGWKKIGEESSEYLARRRGSFFVKRIVRPKYAAPDGEGVMIGELPPMPIHKGNADASILAYILTNKFVYHLPWYRQAQMFKNDGLILSESTMIGWMRGACNLIAPLYDLQKQQLLLTHYLQADETPIPVLSQDAPGSAHKGYYWVYFDPVRKILIIDYQHGRGREGPTAFLKEFKGALQTDGYSVYDRFEHNPDITLLACMVHARRKFDEAKLNDKDRTEEMLLLIQKLYTIERSVMNLSPEEIFNIRQQQAVPILEKIETWLKKHIQETLPKSAIGQAIAYTLNLWPRLTRYVEDGRFKIDNNLIENTIRPLVIGRKNYLFAGSHEAAQRAAMIYSFVGTCKQHQIDPYLWLEDVLAQLPSFKKNDDLSVLIPMNWKPVS